MNKAILLGRLTKDPEIRTSGETKVARYTLAVDRRFKRDGEQSADFISCVVFGKGAEFAEYYLHKGTKICVEGRIQTGSYTNRDGQKVYTTDVVIDSQEFAESKSKEPEPPKETAPPVADGFLAVPDGLEEDGLPWNE